ncbi:MAG: hypothetical protein O7G85_03080, partial [Planctomycetota bacterium]|nr:hypothetical protein [Planctomycetota bacterium]
MRIREKRLFGLALLATIFLAGSALAQNENGKKPDFPPFAKVSEGFTKVVSTADGKPSLYTIWTNKKTGKILAELPRGWSNQKYYFAVTQAGGAIFAGLQGPTRYVYWKRYDNRMALIAPQVG